MTFWTAREKNTEEYCLWLTHFSRSQTRCLAVSDRLILSSWFNIAFPPNVIHIYSTKAKIEKEKFHYLKSVNLKISRRRKSHLLVSRQVVTHKCCGLAVIFCGFISHLIGRETINIPESFSGVYGFMRTTVKVWMTWVMTLPTLTLLKPWELITVLEYTLS